MSNLPALLADYGAYHRDPRNRLTHYFGVPAIVYAILILPALHSATIFGCSVGWTGSSSCRSCCCISSSMCDWD